MSKKMQKYEKYAVFVRYEIWSKGGKSFTRWFKRSALFGDKADAAAEMKRQRENAAYIDKKTKLKHEYEIRLVDPSLFYQMKMHAGRGRYKKVSEAELDAVVESLRNTGDATLDASIGAYVFNTQSHREYIENAMADCAPGQWVRFWHDREAVHATMKPTDVSVYDF